MRVPVKAAWVLAGCLSMVLFGTTYAGMNPGNKAAVYVVPHGASCKSIPALTSCSEITTTYPGSGDIDVIPVFFELNESMCLTFGLDWPSEWGTCGYTTCLPGISIGQIVSPGDGMSTAWPDCRYDWALAHGIGWLSPTGPGAVRLVLEPRTREINVVDCQPEGHRGSDRPATMSSAGVGGAQGDDPCEPPLLPLDITVTNDLDSTCFTGGDTLTFTATYGNTANAAEVHNAILVMRDLTYSIHPEFISFSPGGVFSHDNGSVMWQIGTLAPGETGSREIVLGIPVEIAEPVGFTGEIISDRTPYIENSLVSQLCVRDTLPLNLALSNPAGACATSGEDYTFTFKYNNSKNAFPVHNVVLTDRLPAATSFVSASTGGVYDSGSHSVSWNLGTLEGGQAGSVAVTALVSAEPGVTLLSNCEIRADEPVRRAIVGGTEVCGSSGLRNTDAKVAIHVMPHGTTCQSMPDFASCGDITTINPGCGDIDFIPVFFDLIEYKGVTFAVDWPQDWGSCEFTVCRGDIWMGPVVQPGDGLIDAWSTCQQGWSIAPGYGWLGAAGAGRICPAIHAVEDRLGMLNCQLPYPTYDPVTAIYCAGACGALGDNPCPEVRTEPATWGSIKSMFK